MTTVRLSMIREENTELAELPDPLSGVDEHRWKQLIPHWRRLADRILEDRH